MTYKSLSECVKDLEKSNQLLRIKAEVDPNLEMAEIHRQVRMDQGPAIFFKKVKGSPFPAISNIFGTIDRTRFIFRHTLPRLKKLFELKSDPSQALRKPWKYLDLAYCLWHALPQRRLSSGALTRTVTLEQLPQIKSWPGDGGPYILLPQVYTEDPQAPSVLRSNLGMYRIQLGGGDYLPGQEVGLHYQIRRDIGIHHQRARDLDQPLKVSIFVGGPPGHTFSAVMYLPEKVPEVLFAGMLSGRGFRFTRRNGSVLSLDADFCIVGEVDPNQRKIEGPFGDHLGYYSLSHPFPVMKVHKIYARQDPIWPFTIVGRPPQEDSSFGQLIQEIAGPVIQSEIPGIEAVHAVDASGVHPLLLATGRETFTPHDDSKRPAEILKLAHALLGYGPCALAKYLLITAPDRPLDIHNIPEFFSYILKRIDWKVDLHFETETTNDTLDYSGTGLNRGSKVIMACRGPAHRQLQTTVPKNFSLKSKPCMIAPGILALTGEKFTDYEQAEQEISELTQTIDPKMNDHIPLIILCDDSQFCAQHFDNFLWITFTRSDPARDIYGVKSFTRFKHWGCHGPLLIDARIKPHHAPGLDCPQEIVIRAKNILKNN